MSFASQAIGWYFTSRPIRLAASAARSRSNPVNSPSSPTNPMGGKSWSNPTINVLSPSALPSSPAASLPVSFVSSVCASDTAVVSACPASVAGASAAFDPHPAVMAATMAAAKIMLSAFFFIYFPPYICSFSFFTNGSLYYGKSAKSY